MNTINSHIKLTTQSVTYQPSNLNPITFFDTADGLRRKVTVRRQQRPAHLVVWDRQYVAQVSIEGGEFQAYGVTAVEAIDAAIIGAVRLLTPQSRSVLEQRALDSQRATA